MDLALSHLALQKIYKYWAAWQLNLISVGWASGHSFKLNYLIFLLSKKFWNSQPPQDDVKSCKTNKAIFSFTALCSHCLVILIQIDVESQNTFQLYTICNKAYPISSSHSTITVWNSQPFDLQKSKEPMTFVLY